MFISKKKHNRALDLCAKNNAALLLELKEMEDRALKAEKEVHQLKKDLETALTAGDVALKREERRRRDDVAALERALEDYLKEEVA